MGARARDAGKLLELWTERDLTAAAAAAEIHPAFEVDDLIEPITDIVASGRMPVLVGEPGVGKTAVVHEIARRLQKQVVPGSSDACLIQFATSFSSSRSSSWMWK